MNTWKQKSRLTQANLTSEPSSNLAREQSPMVRYFQEAAAGEQSHPLELDKQMRSRMERQFGLDFSAVRLVESDLPGKLGADAIAQGDLIRFAPGAFHPETAQGEQLLSHELSHVVQQSRGAPGGKAGLPLYDTALERGADVMAAQAMAGELAAGPVRGFSPISSTQAPMQGGCGASSPSPSPTDDDLRDLYRTNSEDGEVPDWLNNEIPAWLQSEPEKPKRPDWLFTRRMNNAVGDALKKRYYDARTAWENRFQFNPNNEPDLEDYLETIDRAATVRAAQAAFKAIPGNENIEGDIGGTDDIDRLNPRSVKLRLKGMVRMMYEFPQLRGQINRFDKVPNANRYTRMAADVSLSTNQGKKDTKTIGWGGNSGAYMEGHSTTRRKYEKRQRIRRDDLADNWSIAHGRWDGTHELGHILQSMLNDQIMDTNYRGNDPLFLLGVIGGDLRNTYKSAVIYSGLTAASVVQQAILELVKDQNFISTDEGQSLLQFVANPTGQRMNANQNSLTPEEQVKKLDFLHYAGLKKDVFVKDRPAVENYLTRKENISQSMLRGLHAIGLTSKYGATSIKELFAEAFANYNEKGENANPLSKMIVKIVRDQTSSDNTGLSSEQQKWVDNVRSKVPNLVQSLLAPPSS